MDRTPVESSSIRSVGYDASTRTLEVEFVTGPVYKYLDVPGEEHEALMAASSKGVHFNERIRNEYRFRRL